MKGLVDNRGAAHHAATTPDSSHYTKGAPGTYTSRRGAAFQPRCREGRWSDCRRCAGVPRVRAVSPPRIELSSTLAARALRLPARPPHPPPGEAAAPCRRACGLRAARALRAARRRRGEPALPRLSRPLVRAWRPRVAAQVRSEWEGKELRGWRRTMGDPRLYLHLCRGARVAAASAGQDGAGDHGTREHMSKTLQSGRAVDLKKSTQVLGSVRSHRRIAALSACCLSCGKRRECRRVSSYTSCRRGSRRRSTVR